MKRSMKLATGALALGLIAATSAGTVVLSKQGDGDRRGHRIDRLFEKLDANGDGAIDRSEAEAARKDRFARADANGDGVISKDEMTAAAIRRAGERAGRIFARLDGNGDGVVDEAEMAAMKKGRHGHRGDRLFDRYDADGDGRVTREEIEAQRAIRRN